MTINVALWRWGGMSGGVVVVVGLMVLAGLEIRLDRAEKRPAGTRGQPRASQ